jgi:cytochrome c oxidase subunit 3
MKKLYGFHLVENSPWPLLGSISTLVLTVSGVLYMKGFKYGLILLYIALILLLLTFLFWFRDVIREATYQGHHTIKVRKGLQLGMILFIISEVCFFVAFFWAYFHSSLTPAVELGAIWPPLGINILNPWNVPLLNTILLLSSGATVTWAHFAIISNNRKESILALILTIIFAILFTALQGLEYYEAAFTIADGVYGSTFFMATGFHGLTLGPTKLIYLNPKARGFNRGHLPNSYKDHLILTLHNHTFSLDSSFIQWFVGFTDAEGNFNITLRNLHNNSYNSVMLTFQIGLHIDDLEVLKFIKSKLNCGHISISGSKCNFFINDQTSLIFVVLPIFKYFPLNSSKYYQFLVFEKAVNLFINKFHLTPQGRLLMIQFYYEMIHNNSLSHFPSRNNISITKYWLGGFTDGDGCFSTNKHVPRLKYENHIKESSLFNHIQLFFSDLINCPIGNFTTNIRPERLKSNPTRVLEFNQIEFLYSIIVPFFQNNNLPLLHTQKLKDFNYWSILVNLNYLGYHLLPEGIEVINLLKSRMNYFRLSTYERVPVAYSTRADSLDKIPQPVINIDEKLEKLLTLASPYEIKNGIRYKR